LGVLDEVGEVQTVDVRRAGVEHDRPVRRAVAPDPDPVDVVGEVGLDPLDAVAHVALDRSRVCITLELDRDADAVAFAAARDRLDPRDGAERLLEGDGDVALGFLRRGVAQARAHAQVPGLESLRQELQRDVRERERPHDDDGDRRDEHTHRAGEDAPDERFHAGLPRRAPTS
jgi:hypothetical protein